MPATGPQNRTPVAATGRSYTIGVAAAILAAIDSPAKSIATGTDAPATAELPETFLH